MIATENLAVTKQILSEVKDKTLSIEQLKDHSITLTAIVLEEAQKSETKQEKRQNKMLAGMVESSEAKAFAVAIADQCFRTQRVSRVAGQMLYIMNSIGIPNSFDLQRKVELGTFKCLGKPLSSVMVPLTKLMMRKEMSTVVIPGEADKLSNHIRKRQTEKVQINLNHLGEAILGEKEARQRLQLYLDDLANPDVECVSVKISTIYSQVSALSFDDTVEALAERLRLLYRAAIRNHYVDRDGNSRAKLVNLDMEEYKDLHLTMTVFRKLLEEPEFWHYGGGMVLQAYLPDSYLLQQELTVWAMQRISRGGAPIRVRLVKGANLAMEQVEASLKGWPQAPYHSKLDVDANFKRMIIYGCEKEHCQAVHIGIASHNIFDVIFALLLRIRNGVEKEVSFEMLEGMADHIRRVVQEFTGDMLLYCPVVKKEDFQYAVAYLVRRLDENTAPENFLRHMFNLKPGSEQWKDQVEMFANSFVRMKEMKTESFRKQNRFEPPVNSINGDAPFDNESDTDWSIPNNRAWGESIVTELKGRTFDTVPIVVGGKEISYTAEGRQAIGRDPSQPHKELYKFTLANKEHIDIALQTALQAQEKWGNVSVQERSHILAKIAQGLRESRKELISVMVADGGKIIPEADAEVSEAIDFAEYYRRNMEEWSSCKDIRCKPRGPMVVIPPWNFPCAIPVGGVLAALVAGNTVIFKPSRDTVLVAWTLVNIFWQAGVPKDVLQFIVASSEEIGDSFVNDKRISGIILTGSTETAKHMLKVRPDIYLMAETGGKNGLIVTNLADRDLAIKDVLYSAFGHAGQKCSAASLLILEKEVYDDPHFRYQLYDAASSLVVGKACDLSTKVNPLIHVPNADLMRGLTELEEGESWLLQPACDGNNPNLWSPGIKWGVQPGSFTHMTELFGPVLGVMRAESLDHAIELVNLTAYGLTGGVHSLDNREHHQWLSEIEIGNAYINRGITGAIVQRQPFGGCKGSNFGPGAKVGGPNYLPQMMLIQQIATPQEQGNINLLVQEMGTIIKSQDCSPKEFALWSNSVMNYAYWWNEMKVDRDVCKLRGQDNFLRYLPHKLVTIRVQEGDKLINLALVCSAALTLGSHLQISFDPEESSWVNDINWEKLVSHLIFAEETEEQFLERLRLGELSKVRVLSTPSFNMLSVAAETGSYINATTILSNGRLELLHYLREMSISIDYHRYGNLGLREHEERKPLAVSI